MFSKVYYSCNIKLSTSMLTTAANKVVKAISNFITRIFNNTPPFLLYARGVHNASRAISCKNNILEVWDFYTHEADGPKRCKRLSKERSHK
jgi:hypothetical protein